MLMATVTLPLLRLTLISLLLPPLLLLLVFVFRDGIFYGMVKKISMTDEGCHFQSRAQFGVAPHLQFRFGWLPTS